MVGSYFGRPSRAAWALSARSAETRQNSSRGLPRFLIATAYPRQGWSRGAPRCAVDPRSSSGGCCYCCRCGDGEDGAEWQRCGCCSTRAPAPRQVSPVSSCRSGVRLRCRTPVTSCSCADHASTRWWSRSCRGSSWVVGWRRCVGSPRTRPRARCSGLRFPAGRLNCFSINAHVYHLWCLTGGMLLYIIIFY